MEEDQVMEMDEDMVEEKDPMETVKVITAEEESALDNNSPIVAASDLKPEPFEEIDKGIFHYQIRDDNDYGGACPCTDGKCGSTCLLRYLNVECGECKSGDKCTNKAMQKQEEGRAKVEVYHTGTVKGFGVRALEPIKKGAFIIEYLGEVVDQPSAEMRKEQYATEFPNRRHHYLMMVTDSHNQPFIIDATKFGNSSRFINHSCEPNAVCEKWSVLGHYRMGYFAKRDIRAGEEISYDYRFDNYGRELIECSCGAPTCRRFLSSIDQAKEAAERIRKREQRKKDVRDKHNFNVIQYRFLTYAVLCDRGPKLGKKRSMDVFTEFSLEQKSPTEENFQKRKEFEKSCEKVMKSDVRAFKDLDAKECKATIKNIIRAFINKELNKDSRFELVLSDDVKRRVIDYTKKYVQRHKLGQK